MKGTLITNTELIFQHYYTSHFTKGLLATMNTAGAPHIYESKAFCPQGKDQP